MKIKPFVRQGHYTVFDNALLDHILPKVSGNEWKILSIIIRKTIGWHKERDKMSFSQIRTLAGIRSDATISKALANLEQANYILVIRQDDQWASNVYALNLDLEIEIDSSTTENEVEPSTTKNEVESAATKIEVEPTTKIVAAPATETKVVSTSKIEDTKQSIKQKKRKGNKDEPTFSETKKTDETEIPAGVNPDYLDLVARAQAERVSERTGPHPRDPYFGYRDRFLAIYQEKTGEYPDDDLKTIIIDLGAEAGANPDIWQRSFVECKLNWTGKGKPPLKRVIEVYRHGGDYEAWRLATYGKSDEPEPAGGGPPPPGPYRIPALTPEQIAAWRKREQETREQDE